MKKRILLLPPLCLLLVSSLAISGDDGEDDYQHDVQGNSPASVNLGECIPALPHLLKSNQESLLTSSTDILVAQIEEALKDPSKSEKDDDGLVRFQKEFSELKDLLRQIHEKLKESKNEKLRLAVLSDGSDFAGPYGGDSSDLAMGFAVYNNNAKKLGLTPSEFLAIRVYSSFSSFGSRYINAILSSKNQEDIAVIQPILDKMDSGLNKLPDYQGRVLRGANQTQKAKDNGKSYKVGQIIRSQIYTSTSINRPMLRGIEFEIDSKHGKDISSFAQLEHEREVLFPRNSSFKVKEVHENHDHGFRFGVRVRVILEEIEN